MPPGPAQGYTLEQAAADELHHRAVASAARWDPVLEVLVPAVVVACGLGVVVAVVALWAVMA